MSIWSDNDHTLWMHSEEWAKVEMANKKAADENPIEPADAERCEDTGLRHFGARWVCGTDTSTVIGHTSWGDSDTVYNDIGDWGEGVYWDAECLPTYVDENGVQYRSMQSYLASREPPAPRPKSKPKVEVEETPRRKAKPEFNPFAQERDFDYFDRLIAAHDQREWNDTYGWIIHSIDDMIQKHPIAEEALKELRSDIIGDNVFEGDEEE